MSENDTTDHQDDSEQRPDESQAPDGQAPAGDGDEFKSLDSKRRVLEDLHGEREARRRAAEERDALAARVKEFEDAKLTADEKMTRDLDERSKRIADLEAENATYQQRLLRRDVADELGLPSWAANRLQGSTEDEVRADAEQFKSHLGADGETPVRPRPDDSQGARPGEKPSDDDLLYAQIYGTRK